MDQRTRDEVIKALRSAARSLRMAEQALVQSPSGPSAPVPTPEAAAPVQTPVDDLVNWVLAQAEERKQFEETDSRAFQRVLAGAGDLLRMALDRKTMLMTPEKTGAVKTDSTPALQRFESLLKAMATTGLEASTIVAPLAKAPVIKNWADVNPDTDMVLLRYQTPGPVDHALDEQSFLPLVEAAKAVPGGLDQATSALREHEVGWEPLVDGKVNLHILVNDIQARWAAVLDTAALTDRVTGQLVLVQTDPNNDQQGWWTAARSSRDIPQAILAVVRGQQDRAFALKDQANQIESWAAGLPGWYDGIETAPTPLIIRDVGVDDILS